MDKGDSGDAFRVSRKFRTGLLGKAAAWRRAFGGKKAVHLVLVTTRGVARGENADVVQAEVTLDDLFS